MSDEEKLGNPWDDVGEAGDEEAFAFAKVMLIGFSGAGKTDTIARWRKPLIALTEPQGMITVQQRNPNAILYRDENKVPLLQTVKDIARFLTMARKAHEYGCDAVCLDSLTETQEIIINHCTKSQRGNAGTEFTSQDTWGTIIKKTKNVIRKLRDLEHVHVVVTCLAREVESDKKGILIRPDVSGRRLPDQLKQFFNAVGYVHAAEMPDGNFRHQVMFRGDDRWNVKPVGDLEMIEPPEPQHWVAKVLGGDCPQEVEERVQQWAQMDTEDKD